MSGEIVKQTHGYICLQLISHSNQERIRKGRFVKIDATTSINLALSSQFDIWAMIMNDKLSFELLAFHGAL